MFAKIKDAFKSKPASPPKKPMELLAVFDSGALPSKDMVSFTKEVNQLIQQYNGTNDEAAKKDFLEQIQKKIKEVDYKYRPNDLAKSPQYLAAHNTLFEAIKYQYASLGNPSVILPSPKKSSPLAEVIANMPTEKANKLLEIMMKGTKDKVLLADDLSKLYELSDNSAEANAFRKFLKNYEVSYLGGGNSKNYKVTGKDGSEIVLKVDCRLNMPRNVEAHLRDKLGDRFTPIDAERQATCLDNKGEKICRTLLVTEFCKGGGVHETRSQLTTVPELVKKTGDVFQQMAEAMLVIQESGCMFPDAKITNWLVDEQGQVRLADTKSFLFTDKEGNYHGSVPGNEHCGFISTPSFNPPEFCDSKLKADSVHAYILGKNLYYYVSGKLGGDDGSKFDFPGQFFQGATGPEYKDLIQGLVNPDPSKRIPLREVVDRLFMINNPEFKNVLGELKKLKFGENDKVMNDFIREKQELISKRKDPVQRGIILKDLEKTVKALNDDKAVEEVRTVVKEFRDGDRWYTRGMRDKAMRIENAMAGVSIKDRSNFLNSGESANVVMKTIASHRHRGKGGVTYLDKTGAIDPEKAAKSFTTFKDKFKAQMDPIRAAAKQDAPDKQDKADRQFKI